ncbi:MAG TPA: alpha/beta hydrolase [Ilumatobacter sp.]|nr:alpha/beta hydrolase [Ilumatobacter sp.]
MSNTTGLAYSRRGPRSSRTVVLLHGWCLNGRLWTHLEEHLVPTYDVVIPDLAGFGMSARLAGPYDLERYTRDVVTLVDELDRRDVVLVGFAFGAAVALACARERPDLIGGIVSIGMPSGEHAPYDRMAVAMRRDWPEFASRSATAICGADTSPATLRWLEAMFVATSLPVATATCALLQNLAPDTLADGLSTPALFVHGADDTITPIAVSSSCAELMSDATLEVVAGSQHLVVIDAKQEVAALVSGFVERLDSPPVGDLGGREQSITGAP